VTYDFLYDKLTRNFFPLRELFLDGQFNLAEEPFFRQLIVTFIHHDLIKMKEKSRTRIPKQSARNLIGVVDEYGVLEYGEVFVQFSNLRSKSLYRQSQSQSNSPDLDEQQIFSEQEWSETTILNNIRVVVTKHPCHHPGDMRTFNAVDKPELRHLRDCIVFPQKGKRPHSNEISGSDLDGDEYAVFWLDLLVPTSDNYEPYDYDSQKPPVPLSRAVTRDDIVDVVLTISEQDCLGKLCCTHLAYVDKLGVQHDECVAIAAAISEELDAGKTGKHPFSEQKIRELNTKLDYSRPDYIDKDQFNLYPSDHVLGKLFRSILRSQSTWSIINHSAYHPEEKDPSYNISSTIERVPIDVHLIHPSYHKYTTAALDLYRTYRDALLNIMFAYHFVSDIDLICRFDSQQQQCMSKHIDVADSAQVELKALMDRIKTLFYAEFNAREEIERGRITMKKEGEIAYLDEKLAKASACYVVCYQYEQAQHPKRILSFPWLFSRLLLQLRQRNLAVMAKAIDKPIVQLREHAIVARVMKNALRKIFEQRELRFYLEFIDQKDNLNPEIILRLDDPITNIQSDRIHLHLIEICFIEIVQNWLVDLNKLNREKRIILGYLVNIYSIEIIPIFQ
jgi:RNA-dependent RNA polymerase